MLVVLIALFNCSASFAQSLSWLKRAGGVSGDSGNSIVVDALGNAFVTGSFSGTATFGAAEPNQTILTSETRSSNLFVAKYNSNGALAWVKSAACLGGAAVGLAIALDPQGNIYVTGRFSNVTIFGAGEPAQTTLTPAGPPPPPGFGYPADLFVAKYSSAGALAWVKQAGGVIGDVGNAIAVDRLGNAHVTGYFQSAAVFGPGETNQATLITSGDREIFIAKFNGNGTLAWVKRAGGNRDDEGSGIAVDDAGDIFVAGIFAGAATFAPNEANLTVLNSTGGTATDIFLAKYSAGGALVWIRHIGGADIDISGGLAVDGSGYLYLTGSYRGTTTFGIGGPTPAVLTSVGGTFDGDVFLARYRSDGDLVWVRSAGGPSGDGGVSVTVDRSGNAYVTGLYGSIATFGANQPNETRLPNLGGAIFIAKYDGDGSLAWVKYEGTSGSDIQTSGIALDLKGNSYITGVFQNTVTFDLGGAHQTTVVSVGNMDVFVAKFGRGLARIDFDNDGQSDIGVYGNGVWSIIRSSDDGNSVIGFGGAGWTPVPADYDGDGNIDLAVYSAGAWSIVLSSDNTNRVVGFGGVDFAPIPADYDGDGKADIAVYSGGVWSILRSSDGGNTVIALGGPEWTPVPADYDGDGKADLAVYSDGAWSVITSSNLAAVALPYGGPDSKPIPADYDGDGEADIAVYTNGTWSIVRSTDGWEQVVAHGGPGWAPVPADYDGDGKTDIAVYNNGIWVIARSISNSLAIVGHGGGPTDVPLN